MPRTSKAGSKTKAAAKALSRKKAATKRATVSARSDKVKAKAVPRTRTSRPSSARMLSKTTMRAKWIDSIDDHEERPGQSLATRNHEVIRKWAEERGAVPATVQSTRRDDGTGVLRFDFPGYGGGRRLQQISWDEWFKTFDERNLVFVYQEHLKKGSQSNFFRLDSPEREEG